MKSLIYHTKKTSRSQTGSRHLAQSGVKLRLSLLVGDFDRMETQHLMDDSISNSLKSLLVGDFDRMETYILVNTTRRICGVSLLVGDFDRMETDNDHAPIF